MERCVYPCVDRTNARRGQRPTSDVFPQTLPRWCLSLDPGTHSLNSLAAHQAPGAILSPPYPGKGTTSTVNTFTFLTWVARVLWPGRPPSLPLGCDPGLFDCKDILCIPKGCRLPRRPPHPTPVVLCMNPHIHTFLWGQFRLNTSWKASWVRLQRWPSCSSSQPQHLAHTSCLCLLNLAYRFWF